MIDITVVRGRADRDGDDIREPLLATPSAAMARGKAELNRGAEHTALSMETTYQPALNVGELIRIVDIWQGTYAALITGITHSARGGTLTTVLELWRPT